MSASNPVLPARYPPRMMPKRGRLISSRTLTIRSFQLTPRIELLPCSQLMWEKASVYKVVQWSDDTHPWIGRFLPQRRSDIRVQTAFRRQYLPAWMRCSLDRTHRCPSWPCPWRPGVRQRHEQSPRRLPHAWLPLEDACFGERANDSYRCSGNCPDAAKGSDQQELIPHRGLNIVWNLALHPPLRLGGATRAPVPSSCCRVPPGRHTERHRHAG